MKLIDLALVYQGNLGRYMRHYSGNYLDFFKIIYQPLNRDNRYTRYLKVSKIDGDIIYQTVGDDDSNYIISCSSELPGYCRSYLMASARTFTVERISADTYRENLKKIIEKARIDLQL